MTLYLSGGTQQPGGGNVAECGDAVRSERLQARQRQRQPTYIHLVHQEMESATKCNINFLV